MVVIDSRRTYGAMLFIGSISHWRHPGPAIGFGEILRFGESSPLRGVHVADAQSPPG
jgi:hypothetical protein